MKKQNQFLQAIKCGLTNIKFSLLLISCILSFTSCKQIEKEESDTNDSQATTTYISSCEDKVGKYSVVAVPTFKAVIEKRDEQNYVLTLNMGIFNPKFQGKCEHNKLTFKVDGTDVEIIGNSFIALGTEFIKNADSRNINKEIITNENPKKTSVSDIAGDGDTYTFDEEGTKSNNQLPFIGLRYYNFFGGKANDESIFIKENGECIIKSIGNLSGVEVYYKGKYKNIIDIGNDTYYKIINDYVYSVDINGRYVLDEESNKPIKAKLYE